MLRSDAEVGRSTVASFWPPVLRFQRLLALARLGRAGRLGHLAVLAGYADQAHMTREICQFAGVTPSALVGKVVSALTLSEFVAGPE